MAENFDALENPTVYRQTLLGLIAAARHRILIAALYLQDDDGGREVLEALYAAKAATPELEIAVFVDWHRARQLGQCVRVIHGKGLGSREGLPVLKQVIRTWLRHHPHVPAFCEADEARGGAGALLVLLRRDN